METVWEGIKWGIGFFIAILIVVVILAIIVSIAEETDRIRNQRKAKEVKRNAKKAIKSRKR